MSDVPIPRDVWLEYLETDRVLIGFRLYPVREELSLGIEPQMDEATLGSTGYSTDELFLQFSARLLWWLSFSRREDRSVVIKVTRPRGLSAQHLATSEQYILSEIEATNLDWRDIVDAKQDPKKPYIKRLEEGEFFLEIAPLAIPDIKTILGREWVNSTDLGLGPFPSFYFDYEYGYLVVSPPPSKGLFTRLFGAFNLKPISNKHSRRFAEAVKLDIATTLSVGERSWPF